MAKVKGGLHSDSVGGAFGESMIFRKGKKSTTVTGYYKPGSAKKFDLSYPQLANRDKYGQIVQAWKALTTEQQEVFNENAKGTEMSGWNLFMKIYGDSMGFKILLTIDKTKMGGTLSDFVTYIDLSLLGDHFWSHVKNGGGDIRIKTFGGSECPLEVVTCDTVLKTGELYTKLPSVSSTVSTSFYILYGDSTKNAYGVAETYGARNVWGANADYIAHLQTNGDDSSAHAIIGTDNSDVTYVAGRVGKCVRLGGDVDYVSLSQKLPKSVTSFSFWTFVEGVTTARYFFQALSTTNINQFNIAMDASQLYFGWRYDNSGANVRQQFNFSTWLQLNTWAKFDVVIDTIGGVHKFYIDGVLRRTVSLTFNVALPNALISLGNGANQSLLGKLDSFRIFNEVTPAERILSRYNNENSPATFYAVSQYSYTKY